MARNLADSPSPAQENSSFASTLRSKSTSSNPQITVSMEPSSQSIMVDSSSIRSNSDRLEYFYRLYSSAITHRGFRPLLLSHFRANDIPGGLLMAASPNLNEKPVNRILSAPYSYRLLIPYSISLDSVASEDIGQQQTGRNLNFTIYDQDSVLYCDDDLRLLEEEIDAFQNSNKVPLCWIHDRSEYVAMSPQTKRYPLAADDKGSGVLAEMDENLKKIELTLVKLLNEDFAGKKRNLKRCKSEIFRKSSNHGKVRDAMQGVSTIRHGARSASNTYEISDTERASCTFAEVADSKHAKYQRGAMNDVGDGGKSRNIPCKKPQVKADSYLDRTRRARSQNFSHYNESFSSSSYCSLDSVEPFDGEEY